MQPPGSLDALSGGRVASLEPACSFRVNFMFQALIQKGDAEQLLSHPEGRVDLDVRRATL